MRVTVTAVPDPKDPNGLDGVVSTIRCAADAGFSRLWFPQPPPWAEVAGWDALSTLAVAGATTPGIELGSSVVVAYTQHPIALARQALTASAATDGRLILGIGVSHRFLVAECSVTTTPPRQRFFANTCRCWGPRWRVSRSIIMAPELPQSANSLCLRRPLRPSSPRRWDRACWTWLANLPMAR
ncbi:MAG: hypothetical protein QOC62_4853 [Mycobacterium sp.]|jgi:hypothetical protein|nr:hypothetical protein [Mycobacterium sp.]